MNNPEFLRNLWLEFSLHRLVAVPLGLGLTLWMASITGGQAAGMGYMAAILFVAFTLVGGTKLTAEGLFREVDERTWDWQRLSGLSPWSMTWGKLLGGPIFTWYAGLWCLLAFALSRWSELGPEKTWQWLALMVVGAVLSHALAFLFALLVTRRQREPAHRRRTLGTIILALLMGIYTYPLAVLLKKGFHWYDQYVPFLDFVLGSVVVLAVWAILGGYRLIREELQYRDTPWVWLTFLGFAAIYAAGFVPGGEDSQAGRLWVVFALMLSLTWITALSEPKDPSTWKRLFAALATRSTGRIIEHLPCWFLTYLTLAGVTLGLMMSPLSHWQLDLGHGMETHWELGIFLFVTRDLLLLLLLSLGQGAARWRSEIATLAYLMILYGVVPGILHQLPNLSFLTALFWPLPHKNLAWLILPPLAQSAGLVAVLIFSWRRRANQPVGTVRQKTRMSQTPP
ncbi:MAG: hypothetical protein WCP34_07010 [Pseudomonadota bacterium]